MDVMRGELEVPPALAGVRVQGNHGIREQVVPQAHIAVPVRPRVAHAPVHEIQFGVVAGCDPDGGPASLPRVSGPSVVAELSRAWDRVEAPAALSGLYIEGVHKPRVPYSPPAVPPMTMSLTTKGAGVPE